MSCRSTSKVERQLSSFEFAIHGETNTNGKELGATRRYFTTDFAVSLIHIDPNQDFQGLLGAHLDQKQQLQSRVNHTMTLAVKLWFMMIHDDPWSHSRMGCSCILEWLYLFSLFSIGPILLALSQCWFCFDTDTWCKWDLTETRTIEDNNGSRFSSQ